MVMTKGMRLEVEVMGLRKKTKQALKLAISSKYIYTLSFSIPLVQRNLKILCGKPTYQQLPESDLTL